MFNYVKRLIRSAKRLKSLDDELLKEATKYGSEFDAEKIKDLVHQGASVQCKERGLTPLHLICRWGQDPDIVEFLIKSGADVNAIGRNGGNTAHSLCRLHSDPEKSVRIAELLIAHGVELNQKDAYGDTPLILAAGSPESGNFRCSIELVDLLISAGAEVKTRGNNERTPLHHAAKACCVEQATTFLKHGCNVNALCMYDDGTRLTPLCFAIGTKNENIKMVRFLVKNGADPLVKICKPFSSRVTAESAVEVAEYYFKTYESGSLFQHERAMVAHGVIQDRDEYVHRCRQNLGEILDLLRT